MSPRTMWEISLIIHFVFVFTGVNCIQHCRSIEVTDLEDTSVEMLWHRTPHRDLKHDVNSRQWYCMELQVFIYSYPTTLRRPAWRAGDIPQRVIPQAILQWNNVKSIKSKKSAVRTNLVRAGRSSRAGWHSYILRRPWKYDRHVQ